MVKAEAMKTSQGNDNVQASCSKGHTSFKKSGDTSTAHTCPSCGHDVPWLAGECAGERLSP